MDSRRYMRPLSERFRAFIRSHTKPMSADEAEEKREFWAKVYMWSGLFMSFYVTYLVYHEPDEIKVDPILPRATSHARLFNITQYRVITYEGFTKVDDFIYEVKDKRRPAKPFATENVEKQVAEK